MSEVVAASCHVHGAGEAARLRRTWRPADGRSVRARIVLCHGTHEHSGRYDDFASLCCNGHGYECHAVDFRGHGRSAGERGDIGSLSGAVADVIALVADVTTPPADTVPLVLMGHSLGSMVAFLAAHQLATKASLPTPDMVIILGFAMDSISPPFGIRQLVPVLRQMPAVVRAVTAALSTFQPQGPACPLPPAHELTSCAEAASATLRDPLHYHGWIQNRTALALLDGRAQCKAILPQWGAGFAFLLVHGEADTLCPRSACDALIAASPQRDKELKVFDGLRHEVLFEAHEQRESVHAHILQWLEARIAGAADAHLRRLRSRL